MRPRNLSEAEYDAILKKHAVRGGVVRHATAGPKHAVVMGTLLPRNTRISGINSAPSPYNGFDSKLEASRWTYLSYLKLAGDIKRVVYHPFKVKLSEKRWYEPDNLIEWKDGRIQIEEVKGSIKMKNARDSITRLHVAASILPMFDWRLTLCVNGAWEERRIQ